MIVSRPSLVIFFFFVCCLIGQAQTSAQPNNPAARKFDEFGDVQYSDLIARLDNFAVDLQNEPCAKGFIVAYRSRRDLQGLSNRYAMRSKGYLVNSRGLAKDRIVTVDGGDADCLTQELWIVPSGTAPKPRPDAYPRYFQDSNSARKIDEYGYDERDMRGTRALEYPTETDVLETFAAELRREKHSQGYIIAYAHFTKTRQLLGDENYDVYYGRRIDAPGSARKRLEFEKRLLVRDYGITPSRIHLIDGGYRKWRSIELWIVPRGEHAPIPTPNSFPRKRARRRK